MKNILIIILLLMIPAICFADILKVPFSCWPRELQSEFAVKGLKVDLSPLDRTNDSWGFIDSKGASFEINSYRAVTQEEFQIVQDVIFKIEFSNKERL